MTEQTPTVSELADGFTTKTADFLAAMRPEAVERTIVQGVEGFAKQFHWKGFNHTPAAQAAAVEEQEKAAYDRALQDKVSVLDKQERQLQQAINADLTAAEELPRSPEILQAKNDNVRLLAEIFEGQLRQEARERVKGRTLGDVAEEYVQTPDEAPRGAEFLRLVESGRGNSFAGLDLREEPDPQKRVAAILKIQKAITDRRRARAEATALEAVEARTKLRNLQASATFDQLRRHVRSGRGVATRPYRRTIVLDRGGA